MRNTSKIPAQKGAKRGRQPVGGIVRHYGKYKLLELSFWDKKLTIEQRELVLTDWFNKYYQVEPSPWVSVLIRDMAMVLWELTNVSEDDSGRMRKRLQLIAAKNSLARDIGLIPVPPWNYRESDVNHEETDDLRSIEKFRAKKRGFKKDG